MTMILYLLTIVLLVLIISYICFLMAFHVPNRNKISREEFPIPEGKIYEPYRDAMIGWIREARSMHPEEFEIKSFDGLTLRGKYYECNPGAPIELMFHGYRGSAERDLCGGVQRCFALGRNALIVNQRGSIGSDGNVITFGILESRDCHSWVDFTISHFGPGVKIILTGISMGASTVMIAAGRKLPENVVGILADCGFTSSRDIIKNTIRDMKLPPNLMYPFVRLGAILFGHFDPDETSATEAMERCHLPVIFFHGEADDYVPCYMSRVNHEHCAAPKKLVTIPGAGHGLSYLVDPDGYLEALREFAANWGI